MKNLVSLGKITKNQGNKGELRLAPITDDLRRFELLTEVFLVSPDKKEKLVMKLEDIWFHKNFVILKIKGINSIGEALKYKNYQVMIEKKDKLSLTEDEYYVDDLIGSQVYLTTDKHLGEIAEIIDTNGTDVIVIEGLNKSYMVPMSKEYVKKIDLKNNLVKINPANNILEL